MRDRNSDGIKRWMGFKADQENQTTPVSNSGGSLSRIRELEAQLADLRSRRDITTLSKEEFEILATETAMSLIRTAQQRERAANLSVERILAESKRAAQSAIEAAENKARAILAGAENKGRRLLEAAENDAKDLLQEAEGKSEELLNTKRREAMAITSTARKEAEQMITAAMSDVSSYRAWLGGVVAEAERLYKVQTSSLEAAASAIVQSRTRLDAAWERLSQLNSAVERTLDESGKPRINRGETNADASKSENRNEKSTKKSSRSKKK
jgi:vacuolar-type H+-ATPase subunit H